jgi:hypothetical protein
MASLMHTIKTKGISNTISRFGMIFNRYILDRFLNSFDILIEVLEEYDAKATFPITATTLERNIDKIKDRKSKSIEWAMHGYIHHDYTKLDNKVIQGHIIKGKRIFNKANIDVVGFRAPYLSIDKRIISILSKNGFLYDSSQCYFVDVVSSDINEVKLILDYYNPLKKWNIKVYNDMIEIPVCLPDDEIIVDRLRYKKEIIGKIWIKMCQKIYNTNGIPVIQLHPERGGICKSGLKILLNWARKNDVEALSLRDIATNKDEITKKMAITGDIDIINISDLMIGQIKIKNG